MNAPNNGTEPTPGRRAAWRGSCRALEAEDDEDHPIHVEPS